MEVLAAAAVLLLAALCQGAPQRLGRLELERDPALEERELPTSREEAFLLIVSEVEPVAFQSNRVLHEVRRRGPGEYLLRLPGGTHLLTITAEDYQRAVQRVHLPTGSIQGWRVRVAEAGREERATLRIRTTPIGARVELNGLGLSGRTPMDLEEQLPPGRYEIVVWLRGYRSEKETVRLSPGEEHTERIRLRPEAWRGQPVGAHRPGGIILGFRIGPSLPSVTGLGGIEGEAETGLGPHLALTIERPLTLRRSLQIELGASMQTLNLDNYAGTDRVDLDLSTLEASLLYRYQLSGDLEQRLSLFGGATAGLFLAQGARVGHAGQEGTEEWEAGNLDAGRLALTAGLGLEMAQDGKRLLGLDSRLHYGLGGLFGEPDGPALDDGTVWIGEPSGDGGLSGLSARLVVLQLSLSYKF